MGSHVIVKVKCTVLQNNGPTVTIVNYQQMGVWFHLQSLAQFWKVFKEKVCASQQQLSGLEFS